MTTTPSRTLALLCALLGAGAALACSQDTAPSAPPDAGSVRADGQAPDLGPWHDPPVLTLVPRVTLPGDCAPGRYPRLVMCPDEVATARRRRHTWPYSAMLEGVRAGAKRALLTPGKTYDHALDNRNAEVARYAGILAILDQDAAMAARVVDATTRLRADWTFGLGLGSTDLFIRIVATLQDGLEGFDLAVGSGLVSASQRAAMEQSLGAIAKRLYDMWVVGPGQLLIKYTQNNYNTKLSTTLGLAALMLDSHPDRDAWLRFAATESNRFYGGGDTDQNLYLSAEGVCKEPPSYFNFGGRAAMPFALLYEYMVGPGRRFKNDCALSVPECTERDVVVPGIVQSELLERAAAWMVRIRMPGGDRPSIDEGRTTGPPEAGALWQYARGNDLLAWDFLHDARELGSVSARWAGYYLARVDFARAAAMPAALGESQFLLDSGQVIFRSDWTEDAVYAAVLGEAGLMRSAVHNHADATSFQMFAYGEMLALDTGYFERPGKDAYTDRLMTVGPEAHNLVLVDGKGAPSPTLVSAGDVDATMALPVSSEGLDHVEVRATYQGVAVSRGVLFAHERYLLVADDLRAKAPHTYAFRLHGFGGGSSVRGNYTVGTFDLLSDRAVWTRPKAAMMLVLDSTHGPPTLTSGTFPHEWKSAWEGHHAYVDGSVTTAAGRTDAAFLGVVMPWRAGDPFPAVKVHEAAAHTACVTVTGAGLADLAAARVDGQPIRVTAAPFAELRTDGRFAWVALRGDGTVARAFVRGGTTLSYGGKVIISGGDASGVATHGLSTRQP